MLVTSIYLVVCRAEGLQKVLRGSALALLTTCYHTSIILVIGRSYRVLLIMWSGLLGNFLTIWRRLTQLNLARYHIWKSCVFGRSSRTLRCPMLGFAVCGVVTALADYWVQLYVWYMYTWYLV